MILFIWYLFISDRNISRDNLYYHHHLTVYSNVLRKSVVLDEIVSHNSVCSFKTKIDSHSKLRLMNTVSGSVYMKRELPLVCLGRVIFAWGDTYCQPNTDLKTLFRACVTFWRDKRVYAIRHAIKILPYMTMVYSMCGEIQLSIVDIPLRHQPSSCRAWFLLKMLQTKQKSNITCWCQIRGIKVYNRDATTLIGLPIVEKSDWHQIPDFLISSFWCNWSFLAVTFEEKKNHDGIKFEANQQSAPIFDVFSIISTTIILQPLSTLQNFIAIYKNNIGTISDWRCIGDF